MILAMSVCVCVCVCGGGGGGGGGVRCVGVLRVLTVLCSYVCGCVYCHSPSI